LRSLRAERPEILPRLPTSGCGPAIRSCVGFATHPQVLSAPQSSLSFVFMPILPESPFFFVDFESNRGSFEFNSLLPRA